MKKLSFMLLAFAMFAFVACQEKPKEEEATEETTTEEVVAPVDETADTAAAPIADDVVEEAPAK